MKTSIMTKFYLKIDLKIMLYFYLYVFSFFLLSPIIINLLFKNFNNLFNLKLGLFNYIDYIFGLFIFIYSIVTYRYFKFAIQNGISRLTLWRSRFLSLLIISIIGMLINFIIDKLICMNSTLSNNNYLIIYKKTYFNISNNPLLMIMLFILYNFFNYIGLILLGMIWGSFRSLISKKVKIIIRIIIPIIIILFIIFISMNLAMLSGFSRISRLLFKIIMDEQGKRFNLLNSIFTNIIFDLILLPISYNLYQKLQIRKNL